MYFLSNPSNTSILTTLFETIRLLMTSFLDKANLAGVSEVRKSKMLATSFKKQDVRLVWTWDILFLNCQLHCTNTM